MSTARSTPIGLASLGVVVALTLWRSSGGPRILFAGIALAAVVLIAAEFGRIHRNLRAMALALAVAGAALLPFARDPLEAISRGVFVGGLLVSLMAAVALLGLCATRSDQVREIGEYLRAQPGARRYLGFTVASQVFSAMLSLAGANILFIMASTDAAAREKSAPMVIAITRGFSAATFWSPMFGNMAILLALYPTLHWIEVFPLGFAMAQATVAVGALLHRRVHGPAAEARPAPAISIAKPLAPLLAALGAFLGTILVTSHFLQVSVTAAIVVLAPLGAWVLNAFMASGRRLRAATAQTIADVRNLPSIASEATLLMSAGCAGTILASAFPAAWAGAIAAALSGVPLLAILALIGMLVAMALAGVHPVLTSVFLASTFTPSMVGLPPIVHFCTILAGWGLSAALTPFSVLSMTASRFSGLGLYRVSLAANWRYTLACVAVFAVALSALVAFHSAAGR